MSIAWPIAGREEGDVALDEPTIPVLGDAIVAEAANDDEEPASEPTEEPPPLTRDQFRSRRQREVRAKTISIKRMTKREIEIGRALYPDADDIERPVTRGDCVDGIRPCPFVGCAHHLFLDINPSTGAIKLNFPDLEPDQLAESCVLDIAEGRTIEPLPVEPHEPDAESADDDEPSVAPAIAAYGNPGRGDLGFRAANTLEHVGRVMNVTRERVRQIEELALRKLALLAGRGPLAAYRDHESNPEAAEFVPHQLPIVQRDRKPDNVRVRSFAPDVDVIELGDDHGEGFVEYETANADPPSIGDESNDFDDIAPNGDAPSIAPEPEEEPAPLTGIQRFNRKQKEIAMECTRDGCSNEARKPRGPVLPHQEGWCAHCRKSGEEPGTAPQPKASPRKTKTPKRTVAKAKKTAKITRLVPPAAISETVSVADMLRAWDLVNAVGIEFVENLAERMGGAGR